ncbi:hypothetical protein E2320_018457, partial [Naja naja]
MEKVSSEENISLRSSEALNVQTVKLHDQERTSWNLQRKIIRHKGMGGGCRTIPYLGRGAELGRDNFTFPCFSLQKGKIITGSLGKRVCALVFIGADYQEQFPTLLGQGNFWLVFFEADSGQYKLCVKAKLTVQITIVVSGKILSIRNYIMSLWVAPQSVTLHRDS